MLPFYIIHSSLWQSALKMLYKLKWFFFSILLIYFFFTPDYSTAQQNTIESFMPLLQGVFRISVLICILFAVNLYIQSNSKEQILSALLWLLLPLKWLKIDIERISLRAVLTLEYIEILTHRMADYKKMSPVADVNTAIDTDDNKHSNKNSLLKRLHSYFEKKKSIFFHLINQSGIILLDILDEAENTSGKSYEIECLQAPAFIQFFIPLIIFWLLFLTF